MLRHCPLQTCCRLERSNTRKNVLWIIWCLQLNNGQFVFVLLYLDSCICICVFAEPCSLQSDCRGLTASADNWTNPLWRHCKPNAAQTLQTQSKREPLWSVQWKETHRERDPAAFAECIVSTRLAVWWKPSQWSSQKLQMYDESYIDDKSHVKWHKRKL